MASSLRTNILKRLEDSATAPVITVLGRKGQATHYSGSQLLSEAEHLLELWAGWLGPGPHVLVVALPAGESFIFTLLASLIGGGTIVPISPPRPNDPPDRLKHIVASCGATAVLCTSAQRQKIEIQLRNTNGPQPCQVIAIDAPNPEATARLRPRPSGIPIIQYTSGSTRLPKAISIHASQIQANCAMVQRLWQLNEQSTFVNWLPHYHDMGLMGCILYPLLNGARSIQMSPFEMIRKPSSWLQAISDYQGAVSGGPSFAYQECLNRIAEEECQGLDLSTWQRAFCGSEPIPSGLLDRFRQRFGNYGLNPDAVFACYGMAEFTLFAAGQPNLKKHTTTNGMTVEPCMLSAETRQGIRITDPQTGAPLPEGELGEIWLSGASASKEYLELPEETSYTFDNEIDGVQWMRTGDLGVIKENLLYVTGRQKDILIANGRKISAAEVEWLAAQQSPSLNPMAAAAFMPTNATSGHAVLFIELRPGKPKPDDASKIIEQIRRVVSGNLSIALTDIRILSRGELARTSSGKIRRQHIAATYQALCCSHSGESI